jgi:hypothetical protein
MNVAKFSFNDLDETYLGVVISTNHDLVFAYNFSNDLDLDGVSFIHVNAISKISKKGKLHDFYSRVLEVKKQTEIAIPPVLQHLYMKDAVASLKGIVGLDYLDRYGNARFLIGYVEKISERKLGLRYVRTNGEIDWGSLDQVAFSKIIRLQSGGRYLNSIELLHLHDGLVDKELKPIKC